MDSRRVWILSAVRSTAIMLEGIFRRAGFDVERLPGETALYLRLRLESPDLLVLDEAAVRAAGQELCDRLERCAARPGVITVTEAAEAQEYAEALQGVQVRRPVQAHAMVAAARRLLAAPPARPPAPAADVALVGFGEQAGTLAAALEAAGHRTACLAPAAAAAAAAGGRLGVLVLDLQDAGAERVLRGLRAANGLPLVTVGRVDWQRARDLRLLPAVTFLERPVELPQLLGAVAAYRPAPRVAGDLS